MLPLLVLRFCLETPDCPSDASIPAARFLFPSFSASWFQFCFPRRGRIEVFKDAQSHMNVVNTYECPYKSSKINRSNLKTSSLEAADSRPRGSGSIPIMVPKKVAGSFISRKTHFHVCTSNQRTANKVVLLLAKMHLCRFYRLLSNSGQGRRERCANVK